MANKIIATIAAPKTKETFINDMKALWKYTQAAYRNIYDTVAVPNWTAWNNEYVKETLEKAEKWATEYAEKKWKTEKRRAQYVYEYMAKKAAELNSRTAPEFRQLSFVDFDVNPGRNSLSGNCCLSKFTDEELIRCWEEIKDNEYFKSATHLSIGYLDSDTKWRTYYDGLCGFRPQVYMTMPEDMDKKFHDEAEALAEDISRFYANCHYAGD